MPDPTLTTLSTTPLPPKTSWPAVLLLAFIGGVVAVRVSGEVVVLQDLRASLWINVERYRDVGELQDPHWLLQGYVAGRREHRASRGVTAGGGDECSGVMSRVRCPEPLFRRHSRSLLSMPTSRKIPGLQECIESSLFN
ncbi:hypothetical protein E2C01_042383 [Portunus trituberculatus]|uniref:Uncharacterized protein n=1 Tax=Portunus trituberculatus TaxID=210409 RepID=A0A5B7FWC8_PORTR|nr:hypothetical protein [Portunus trituberculatus]